MARKPRVSTDATEFEAFAAMAREFPVRTGIYTMGLPLFAALQLLNAVLFEGSLPIIAVFAALTVVASIQLTRYHVAIYRRRAISDRWIDGG